MAHVRKIAARALVPALAAPAASLATARLTALAVALLHLGWLLPTGVHTYLPLAAVVPLWQINLGAAAMLLLACGVAARGPRTYRGSPWRALVRFGLMLALAQLVLYVAQVVALSEYGGMYDSSAALALAPLVEAVLFAFAIGLGVSAAVALGPLAHATPGALTRALQPAGTTPRLRTQRCRARRATALRGPPLQASATV